MPAHKLTPEQAHASAVRRFWNYVPNRPEVGCWEWVGYRYPDGYGQHSICYEQILAHRFSWFLHTGVDAGDMYVLHHCDNPPCVRYHHDHLFLGTQADNLADMDSKGRRVSPDRVGAKNPSAKLTGQQVLEIIKHVQSGNTHTSIAREYGISAANVSNIINGRTWNHLTNIN